MFYTATQIPEQNQSDHTEIEDNNEPADGDINMEEKMDDDLKEKNVNLR